MKFTSYRLAEYKICEGAGGGLWWESHFGFGLRREGACFVRGAILFMEPWMNETPGLLIMEFDNQLKRLPVWDRTPFFCRQADIRRCDTGQSVSWDALRDGRSDIGRETTAPNGSGQTTSWRLDRYEISRADDGEFRWRTAGRRQQIRSGRAMVVDDILFLDLGEERSAEGAADFSDRLGRLPLWTHTPLYALGFPIRSSDAEAKAVGAPRQDASAAGRDGRTKSVGEAGRDRPVVSYPRPRTVGTGSERFGRTARRWSGYAISLVLFILMLLAGAAAAAYEIVRWAVRRLSDLSIWNRTRRRRF